MRPQRQVVNGTDDWPTARGTAGPAHMHLPATALGQQTRLASSASSSATSHAACRPARSRWQCTPAEHHIGYRVWSSAPCSQQQATMDRAVSVPDKMPWDQKVKLGEASWAQARATAAPPPQVVVQQVVQNSRQAECEGLRDSIANIDSQARLPQTGQMQDWLKQRRRELSDQRYRMQCQ